LSFSEILTYSKEKECSNEDLPSIGLRIRRLWFAVTCLGCLERRQFRVFFGSLNAFVRQLSFVVYYELVKSNQIITIGAVRSKPFSNDMSCVEPKRTVFCVLCASVAVLENYSPLFKDRFPISLTNIWLILGVSAVWVSIHFAHKVT
jgi:hypothetical protein